MARKDHVVDEWLVLAAQDGDAKALDRLVRRWHGRLWRHARNMTGRDDAAADVSQDAWVGIIKQLRGLEDPAAFPAWAYRIVTRRAADWVRRQVRQRARAGPLTVDVPAPPDPNDDPESREQAAVVLAAMQKLPTPQRAVLSMHYLDDLSTAEIAVALNIPRGTVKSRMHQARRDLRELLKGNEP